MNATPSASHPLHITLRDGFRGHTVLIAVDGIEVFRGTGVTTDRTSARPDGFVVTAASAVARVAVSVTPGDVAASLEFDVSRHPYVAISLVGTGTVSFETSPRPSTTISASNSRCMDREPRSG
jgi:hypothetical protein